MDEPNELLEQCKNILTLPPEIAQALLRLETKRIQREPNLDVWDMRDK